MIATLGVFGGLMTLLTLIHFVVDWGFQTHAEAMTKHNNPWIRGRHCAIYTLGFIPFLMWCGLSAWPMVIATQILFWSHFAQDTYISIYYWMRYVRRPPEMLPPNDPKLGFVKFIDTTLGKILMITVDQIIHVLFLLPIAWMLLNQ